MSGSGTLLNISLIITQKPKNSLSQTFQNSNVYRDPVRKQVFQVVPSTYLLGGLRQHYSTQRVIDLPESDPCNPRERVKSTHRTRIQPPHV